MTPTLNRTMAVVTTIASLMTIANPIYHSNRLARANMRLAGTPTSRATISLTLSVSRTACTPMAWTPPTWML